MSERYPFNPEDYSRGDLVPVEAIEKAYGCDRKNETYRLFQMKFRNVLDHHFQGVVPIRCVGKGLYILPPDQEQVDYFHEEMHKVGRRLTKRLMEVTSVDSSLVEASEMKRLTERVAKVSWLACRLRDRSWKPPEPPEPPKQIT